jgi:hypothetical protein
VALAESLEDIAAHGSVAVTTTTRCPAVTARARVPPVRITSSTGWAWNATTVAMECSMPADARVQIDIGVVLSRSFAPPLISAQGPPGKNEP